ncbi:MAG: nucleoside hydrolase [Bacillota bacterium]
METKIPAIIDCDPGHDDAVAIMLALGSGRFDLLGITTVAGNSTGENTYRNALRVLDAVGASVPVCRGADKPLMRPLVTAPAVHGAGGLGVQVPERPGMSGKSPPAVEFIASTLSREERKVTLIPVGPLTNIAAFLLAHPGLREKIDRIVLMGGAAGEGNWTPAAEFNMFVDPEAARVVFESGVPITMIGLDVTHKALMFPHEVEALRESGPAGRFAAGLLDSYSAFYRSHGFPGNPIHDALAVAAACEPDIVKTRRLRVDVETRGEFTLGRTVVDFGGVTGREPNGDVALEVDRERFIGMVTAAIAALDVRLTGGRSSNGL